MNALANTIENPHTFKSKFAPFLQACGIHNSHSHLTYSNGETIYIKTESYGLQKCI